MTEQDDPSEAVERLERALERIAALAAVGAARPAGGVHAPRHLVPPDDSLTIPEPGLPPSLAEGDLTEMAERLDQLIAQLRAALGTPAGS